MEEFICGKWESIPTVMPPINMEVGGVPISLKRINMQKNKVKENLEKMSEHLIHEVFGQQGSAKTPEGFKKLVLKMLQNAANQGYMYGRERK